MNKMVVEAFPCRACQRAIPIGGTRCPFCGKSVNPSSPTKLFDPPMRIHEQADIAGFMARVANTDAEYAVMPTVEQVNRKIAGAKLTDIQRGCFIARHKLDRGGVQDPPTRSFAEIGQKRKASATASESAFRTAESRLRDRWNGLLFPMPSQEQWDQVNKALSAARAWVGQEVGVAEMSLESRLGPDQDEATVLWNDAWPEPEHGAVFQSSLGWPPSYVDFRLRCQLKDEHISLTVKFNTGPAESLESPFEDGDLSRLLISRLAS